MHREGRRKRHKERKWNGKIYSKLVSVQGTSRKERRRSRTSNNRVTVIKKGRKERPGWKDRSEKTGVKVNVFNEVAGQGQEVTE